jgi:hypothetical protein
LINKAVREGGKPLQAGRSARSIGRRGLPLGRKSDEAADEFFSNEGSKRVVQ